MITASKYLRLTLLALMFGFSHLTSATVISSPNLAPSDESTSGGIGFFFDIQTFSDITITQIDIYSMETGEPGGMDVSVYYRPGSYLGSQTSPGDWTLLQNFSMDGNGQGEIDELTLSNGLDLALNNTYGFYVTANDGGLQYDDDNGFDTSNNDLRLFVTPSYLDNNEFWVAIPNGTHSFFEDEDDFIRFVGNVHYETQVGTVSEPGTLSLFLLAGLGFGFLRWRHMIEKKSSTST